MAKSSLLKKQTFKSVHVAVVNEWATLVPSALFRTEDAEKYFQFNFSAADVNIHSEKIAAYDLVTVFACTKSLEETLNRIFDSPVLHHHSTSLLEGIHLAIKRTNDKTLLVNVRSGFIDVLITEGKKLIFMNSFPCRNSDDLCYYVMYVCDRLQLNPEMISMYLTGDIQEESTEYQLLYRYIRNIKFFAGPAVFDFSYVFKEIPGHIYFNLFSLALCES